MKNHTKNYQNGKKMKKIQKILTFYVDKTKKMQYNKKCRKFKKQMQEDNLHSINKKIGRK